MCTLRRFAIALWFVSLSFSLSAAQEGKTNTAQPSRLTVTASTAPDGVRFAVLGEATELRLEIYSATGEQAYDSGFRKGAVLDWQPQNEKTPLQDGAYLCVVTYRDVPGRLRQKLGELSVEAGQASLRQVGQQQLLTFEQSSALAASRKAQSIETEGHEALTILPAGEIAVTVATHDGEEGRVVSTQGDLTFRTGDFFGGGDKVRMRITEEGRVGIGTDNPEAMFDVAGAIRARGGIVFNDGTALTSTGRAGRVNSFGDVVPNAAGTGTQNFIAKWTETGGAGTLGDSAIFESGGKVGINTTTPLQPFTVQQNNGTAGVNVLGELFVDRANNGRSASLNVGTAGTPKWIIGMVVFSDGFQVYDLTANQSRIFVNPANGNVGLGTTTPGVKLDVTGTISTSTQYNLGAARILSAPGTNNLFAGVGSGAANTTGLLNSFFGHDAGLSNTEGFSNSFFGASAGKSNTTADFNSFFGSGAGELNTEGHSNSFFGTGAGAGNMTGFENSFFGRDAGLLSTTGVANSFFGVRAGRVTTGFNNSFFGWNAGMANTSGGDNAFFGVRAGLSNTEGERNSFFGQASGVSNTEGSTNSFYGWNAGFGNRTGSNNTFIGSSAGDNNDGGSDNTFIGDSAGDNNDNGNNNTIIGADADLVTGNLSFATAIGAGSRVSNINSIVLGRSAGQDTVRIPGSLIVTGTVSKGGGSFKIDHPLDPLNKTLSHSFVESPDMMNVYNGNITTDAKGTAIVTLPDYFEALNRDFRYQLTVVGQFAQAIVAHEVKGNRFVIKTNKPRVKVSWQVTGIRQDAYANTNRIPVEEDKPEVERGTYLHPGAFAQPEGKSIRHAAEARPRRRTKVVRAKRPPATR